MDISINGSYEAYGYIVLLQVSLLYMQRPDLIRRIPLPDVASTPANDLVDSHFMFTRFLGTILSWASWMPAIFIGHRFGVVSGSLFFLIGFGTSVLAMLVIPPFPRMDVVAHVISLPATLFLFYATLLSVGIDTAL